MTAEIFRQLTGHCAPRVLGPQAGLASWLRALIVLVLAGLMVGLGLAGLAPRPARALDVEFATRPVKRDILALFDSRHETAAAQTRIHRLAEMPLNWLGYKVTYADINAPLPEPQQLQKYRAVVTWFIEPMQAPSAYLDWLDQATATGLRYICFGEPATPEPVADAPRVERILDRLGLKPRDQFISVTTGAKVVTKTAAMIGFERALDKALPEFRVIESAAFATRVHLSVSVPDAERDVTSVLVATGPGGGYAADAYTIYFDQNANRARWVLNPFLFLEQALGEERFPIPDATTLVGRRMYFSHIDGDGWNNISEIEGYRETQTTASDVILREVIEPYPDLPVSVGLIAADALAEYGGKDSARKTAQALFALPQVEVATHTYSHPFAWGFFENYNRQAELDMIDKAAHPTRSIMDRLRGLVYGAAGKSDLSAEHNPYVAGSADLPRGYLKEPFSVDLEINGALRASESLAPPGKKAAIYLWSGDAEPFEAAVKATRLAGVRNMNGGDNRLDAEFPSVFYVPPISRPVGAERQIYAANSNENTYTNFWHGPFYGQMMLKDTLVNTEAPRRLKPFNLYYHMYSGEKPGALAAIKMFVDMARSSDVIPVKASEYAAIADDYFAVELKKLDESTWEVAKRGNLQTVRFDAADDLDVDLLKSTGVLGATRHQGALYIALDPAVEPALVGLRPVTTAESGQQASAPPPAAQQDDDDPRTVPRLLNSRWQVRALTRDACSFAFEAQGFGPGDMVWQARPQQAYSVEVTRGQGTQLFAGRAVADAAGRIPVALKVDALEPVQIRFACHES